MEHRVRTGTARGTLMKRVPLKHTEDGQCMSSSGAWTSVPASHQATSGRAGDFKRGQRGPALAGSSLAAA